MSDQLTDQPEVREVSARQSAAATTKPMWTADDQEMDAQDFASLLDLYDNSFRNITEGEVVKGTVLSVSASAVIVDVGFKSEGMIPLDEFLDENGEVIVQPGDTVDVLLERTEDRDGHIVLSREKAEKMKIWDEVEKAFADRKVVIGRVIERIKGGLAVDIGVRAFLPGSQIDVRPVRNLDALNKKRGNIVLSRKVLLEEENAEKKKHTLETLAEGKVMRGVVKNITDYGAFIDLGGIDGLLHVTDMAWRRVNHPSDVVNVGDTVKVQIIRINPDTQRISLGMKQLQNDPWQGIEAKYPVGARFSGTITNIADYGAFVELEPGVEGLIHVSEMSWTKKNTHPGKIVSTSQQVDVQVLEVDPNKRRISLGLKQTQENPWDGFLTTHPKGTLVEGPIRNITEFGLFIGLDGGVDGMVHLSDLDWNKSGDEAIKDYKKGDNVKAVVLDVDSAKERISLGIKQVAGDPLDTLAKFKKGDPVTCEVIQVEANGIQVRIADTEITSYVKRSDLSRDRSEQRPERFNVGDKVDAAVISVDKTTRRIQVSVKALEIAEEKQAVAQYGSSDSGASLGDIFKAALKRREGGEEEEK